MKTKKSTAEETKRKRSVTPLKSNINAESSSKSTKLQKSEIKSVSMSSTEKETIKSTIQTFKQFNPQRTQWILKTNPKDETEKAASEEDEGINQETHQNISNTPLNETQVNATCASSLN